MDMFFVKQMQALNEFFLLCRCYAAASKGKLTRIHDGTMSQEIGWDHLYSALDCFLSLLLIC